MSTIPIHEYDLYIDQQVFDEDYIDDDELQKASEIIHKFFYHKIIINLNDGYQLVFEPIIESTSATIGKILTSDASNLQNYIHSLRFKHISISNKKNNKHKSKLASAFNYFIRSVHNEFDKDGFTSYNPDFISDVLGKLQKTIYNCYDHNDFSFFTKKLSEDDKLVIYQTLQEIHFILDLLFKEEEQ